MRATTGALGWTGRRGLQLGGPPLHHVWDIQEPAPGVPMAAHVYDADNVTYLGSLALVSRPAVTLHLSNGGPDPLDIEVESRAPIPLYGQVTWGQFTYGGQVTHGNIVRLTEQGGGGDGRVVYQGTVEEMPDQEDAGSTSHRISLVPFAVELSRAFVDSVYTAPTDVAQMARDAVAACQYCHCDPVSIPISTGIFGLGDFRNRPAQELLETARSIAGPSWFWHVDVNGRVWFQFMGSQAGYTVRRGVDYRDKQVNGGSIVDLKNKIVAVGGLGVSGQNVTAEYNGTSQSRYGIRALNPPLSIPGINDQTTLQAVVDSLGATLDRTVQQVSLRAFNTGSVAKKTGGRLHGSRPGGALIRYWDPTVAEFPETSSGSGYHGPFLATSYSYDGEMHTILAGDQPVVDTQDIDALVSALVSRLVANNVAVTAAALNLTDQVLTGTFRSSTGTARWQLDPDTFSITDPNGKVRVEQGNLITRGISPAQWGERVNDENEVPIFDTQGLIDVMSAVGSAQSQSWSPSTLNGVAGSSGITGSGGEVQLTSAAFTLNRQTTVLLIGTVAAAAFTSTGIVPLAAPIYIRVDGQVNSASSGVNHSPTAGNTTAPTGATPIQVLTLPGGSYTARMWWNSVEGTTGRLDLYAVNLFVFRLGK